MPSTTSSTVGVRSDTRTRSLTRAARIEQVGQPRADPGVAQRLASERTVRVGRAVGPDAGGVPEGVDDLVDPGPDRGQVRRW